MNDNESIKILVAGDFLPPQLGSFSYSEDLKKVLLDKDFSIINLEAPLTHSDDPIDKNSSNFKISPLKIKELKEGAFDAVSLSNNHIRDYGDEGVQDTLKVCHANNILTVGAGKDLLHARKPLRINLKEKKLSLLNYSEKEFNIATAETGGANPYDTITAFQDIQKEKHQNDFVIVIYHGGLEHQYYPTPEIVRNFKFLIDAGADAIVSHHTHRYSGVLRYNDKPILFGLGNFFMTTKMKVNEDWLVGLLAAIRLGESTIDFELLPVRTLPGFDRIGLMDSEEVQRILKHIDEISTDLNDDSFLSNYWISKDMAVKQWIFHLMKSNSRFEYRLRKYIPFLFSNSISRYKQNLLLNLIRCDSHRHRLIRILEKNGRRREK